MLENISDIMSVIACSSSSKNRYFMIDFHQHDTNIGKKKKNSYDSIIDDPHMCISI